jgi:hypothetical protein
MSSRSLSNRIWNRLCLTKAFRQAATPLAPIPNPDRWIFIIGCYNSGTTLLKSILAEHEDITQLPSRGGAYAEELEWPEQYGWTRMWHKCYEELRMEPSSEAERRARSIQRKWGMALGGKPSNVLVKSITDAVRIPFLNAYFRPAYFIYIVRNGYAVAEGIRRKADPADWGCTRYADGYPIELCAEQWKESDRVIERNLPRTDNSLHIPYENLCEQTSKTVRRITDFLDLTPIPEKKLNRVWSIHEVDSRIKNLNGKSISNLKIEEVKRVREVARKTLSKYGYNYISKD